MAENDEIDQDLEALQKAARESQHLDRQLAANLEELARRLKARANGTGRPDKEAIRTLARSILREIVMSGEF